MNPGSPSVGIRAHLLRRVATTSAMLLFALVWLIELRPLVAAEASAGAMQDIESPKLIDIGKVQDAIGGKKRVKVVGTLMLETEPGYLILHDKTGDIRVRLSNITNDFSRGDLLEVTGLPIRAETRVWLELAEARRVGKGIIPPPLPIKAEDALKGLHDAQYVVLEGQVVGTNTYTLRGITNEVLLVDSGGTLCKAMFAPGTHPERLFPAGTVAEFTGICRLGGRVDESRTRYLHILAHSPEAVHVLQGPSFWSPERLRSSLAITFILLCAAGSWMLFQWWKLRLLRASEKRFRALVNNSFDATVVLNADLGIKYISSSAMGLFGSANPTNASSLIHPDDLALVKGVIAELIEKPAACHRIPGFRILTTNGNSRDVEAIATNCRHVTGVDGVVLNIRDITEHKRVDDELRRSETVTRTIHYFATSMLEQDTEEDILWDLAGNCISQLGFVDCVIYLLDPEKKILIQKAAMGPKNPQGRVILNPIIIPLGQGIVGSVAASGKAELIANTTLDPRYIVDDDHRFSEITVPIIVEGKVIGVIDSEHPERNFFTTDHLNALTAIASLCANKIIRVRAVQELRRLNSHLEQRVADRTRELRETNTRLQNEIAARENAEADLRVALEAEKELNQLKSLFVSMVSHEFRTPLGVILSSSNILDRYLDRLPADKRKAQLRAIRKSIHRMNDLIEDVLLLGKLDAGILACHPSSLDLAATCRRVAAEIESASTRENAIRLIMDEINGEATGDESLLHHILINLLGNALKYSPPDSQVDFEVHRRGINAEFVIRDHGCGIPVADQTRLFTAFYRGGNVGQTQGSGLGLVIVKRCVDLHGGTIRCESEEGRGTTFTVSLPLFDGTRMFRRRNGVETTFSPFKA